MSFTLDRLLHVEDDEHIREILKLYLADWGGKNQEGWFEAGSVAEALRITEAHNNNFQLAIIDLNLEDSWGMETLRALRPCTVAPFVVCTGSDGAEVQERAKEYGVYGIINKGKSFSRERIIPIIRDAYLTWRDENILLPLQKVNERLSAAMEQRVKILESYGRKG